MTDLPPELWICIFDYATYVPGALIPEVYDNARLVGTIHTKSSRTAIRAALVTKRALVCVCKRWWHLAIPYLYRSVYIGRAHALPSLLNTFLRSASRDTVLVGTTHLGEYTERLDVAVRMQYPTDNGDSEFGSFSALIRCMPHLAIIAFSFAPNFYTPSVDVRSSIVSALQHSAASLRILDWPFDSFDPSTLRIAEFVTTCTQLRFLHCPHLVWSKDLGYGGIPHTLTAFHTQVIIPIQLAIADGYTSDLSTSFQPGPSALRDIILDLHWDANHWEDLLSIYGPQLVSVQLCIPNFSLTDFKGSLKVLKRVCPRLSHLTLTADRFSSFSDPDPVFPSIKYLALRVTRVQSSKADFELLIALLAYVRSSVPTLQTVQLLNERNVQCLLKIHTKMAMRTLLPFLEATAFRVEDQDCVLLKDRLKALDIVDGHSR